MANVKTVAGEVEVPTAKTLIAENLPGFQDGEEVIVFGTNDRCKFKIKYPKDAPAHKKHVPDGTILDLHVLDAAVAEKQGKGEIVK